MANESDIQMISIRLLLKKKAYAVSPFYTQAINAEKKSRLKSVTDET